MSKADELEKLARLKAQGILSEKEYRREKKKLLGPSGSADTLTICTIVLIVILIAGLTAAFTDSFTSYSRQWEPETVHIPPSPQNKPSLQKKEGIIPGLQAENVIKSQRSAELAFDPPDTFTGKAGETFRVWHGKALSHDGYYELRCDIYGYSDNEILSVQFTADDITFQSPAEFRELCRNYLCYSASVPLKNVSREKVKNWIEENTDRFINPGHTAEPDHMVETEEGNLRFILGGHRHIRSLLIIAKTEKAPAAQAIQTKETESYGSGDICPQSSSAQLRPEDLENLDREHLILMRNEIHARHGCDFQEEKWKDYFSRQSWYRINPGYHSGLLNEIEKYNDTFILEWYSKKYGEPPGTL